MFLLSLIGSLVTGVASVFSSSINATTVTTVAGLKYGSSVVVAAMNHNIFWYAWAIAAFPSVGWYALAMVDTAFPGHGLPTVAIIPDTIKPYFDTVFGNIFWTGAAGFGVQTVGNVATSLFDRIFGEK